MLNSVKILVNSVTYSNTNCCKFSEFNFFNLERVYHSTFPFITN